MLPALNKKRKISELTGFMSARNHSKSSKAFEILPISKPGKGNTFEKLSELTRKVRRFDTTRETLFKKPKHQVSLSRLMNDTSIDLEEINKTRPFSLEQRNMNTNDISFSRLLRSDNGKSLLNISRVMAKPQPPSFYEKDMKVYKRPNRIKQ